jgi:predicted nucleic acid-binding protein
VTVFADSSALVTLHADEPGHERVRGLSTLVVSQLARVEVPSAIRRKQRLGELDAGAARLLTSAFEADGSGTEEERPRFSVVTPTVAVLERAARLCAVHGLRAYDAVQLACGSVARDAVRECRTFAAFDRHLRGAAAAEGFSLVPAVLEA